MLHHAFDQSEHSTLVKEDPVYTACCFHESETVPQSVVEMQSPSPFPISYPGQHASGTRNRQRQSELRVLVAHIYRYVAGALQPGSLTRSAVIRDRMMAFMNDTLAHLSTANLGAVSLPSIQSLQSL